MISNTLYLWDLADTVFSEEWDTERTGLESYDAYIESLGFDLNTIDPLAYEQHYEQPFKDGRMKLSILEGFEQALSWTKHNAVFTTGNKEQIQWRAEVFLQKGLIDVRPFFETIYSTFDFGNTNQKAEFMYRQILEEEAAKGYKSIIYADNKLENCQKFQQAANQLKNKITTRLYHINIHVAGINKMEQNFFSVPNLLTFLNNEKSLTS